MQNLWATFEAKVVVGIQHSVALVSLASVETTECGTVKEGGSTSLVAEDIDLDSVVEWWCHVRPKSIGEEMGTYYMTGRVCIDEELATYSDIKVARA